MGRFAFILVAGVLLSGGAQASSIVSLEATDEPVGPSMIVIGAPAEPAMVEEETPTGTQLAYPFPGGIPAPVVSLGAASDEKVAVVEEHEDAPEKARFTPMVIRGGIVGDAFVRSIAPTSEGQTASAQTTGQDASEQAEAAPPPPGSMPELSAPR